MSLFCEIIGLLRIIVQEQAVVTLGSKDNLQNLFTGEIVSIPKQVAHRIQNPTKDNLVCTEIQSGDVLDENDITRLEDEYGRSESFVKKRKASNRCREMRFFF